MSNGSFDADVQHNSTPKVTPAEEFAMPSTVKGTRSSSRRQKSMFADIAVSEIMDLSENTVSQSTTNADGSNKADGEPATRIKRSERLMSRSQRYVSIANASGSKTTAALRALRNTICAPHITQRLLPFVEVKQEQPDEGDVDGSGAVSAKDQLSTISLSSSRDTEIFDIDMAHVKQEVLSDNEDQIIITDDFMNGDQSSNVNDSNISQKISRLMNSLDHTSDGIFDRQPPITLSRITTKAAHFRTHMSATPKARKSFPNGLSLSNGPQFPLSNMVYIPIENTCDLMNNSILSDALRGTNPPPLVSVGPSTSGTQSTATTARQIPNALATPTNNVTARAEPVVMPSSPMSTVIPLARAQSKQNLEPVQTVSQMLTSSSVSDNLASAVSDIISRAPPKLKSKPTGAMRSDGDVQFPGERGNVSKLLIDNAHKMTDFFRTVIEDTLQDMGGQGNLEARIQLLELELENMKTAHTKKVTEMQANNEKLLNELKSSMEKERVRAINEVRGQCESDRIRMVEETKQKQWCKNCLREAQMYCCWNTSYCDYPCQQAHWTKHRPDCAQAEIVDGGASASPNIGNVSIITKMSA